MDSAETRQGGQPVRSKSGAAGPADGGASRMGTYLESKGMVGLGEAARESSGLTTGVKEGSHPILAHVGV